VASPYQKRKVNKLEWEHAIASLKGAYSDSTLRGYRADFAVFEDWCARHRRSALPASPKTLALFLDEQAKTLSTSSLRRRQASVRKIHRLLHLPNPADSEEVAIAFRRAQC
jgi:integrase/recombinase XerD